MSVLGGRIYSHWRNMKGKTVSKEWFIQAHSSLIEEYLEKHPHATEAEAYDATADAAYNRMRENMADMADYFRKVKKGE